MKKYFWGLVLCIAVSLCGCTNGSNEQKIDDTGQEESQNSAVAENMLPNASDDMSDSDLATVGESWEDAYKSIICDIDSNLDDPYNYNMGYNGYVYLGIHDFNNDDIPELIIGNSVSAAVFTYENGNAVKIADLYEPEDWGAINGLCYKDNYIVLVNSGSWGSGYVCFTYDEGEYVIGFYDDYNPDQGVINGNQVTGEVFRQQFKLVLLTNNSRIEYSKINEEDGIILMANGESTRIDELDFRLLEWQDKQQNNSTTVLTYEKEGEQEEKTASLYMGEGYSLYVIDGDWSMYLPDAWEAESDQRIRFFISSYEGLNASQAERILTGYGYMAGDGCLWKQESDILYKVKCYETESDVWRLEAVYPTEAEEDWEAEIWAMFDTFEVEEGYSVGEHTPKAVMPEGEYPQLYEVTYTDSASRAWAVHEPEYAGSYIYDELTISNITDTSFDFTVTRRNFETDKTEVIIPEGTAYINEDMISATYTGEDYTLTFDFSDSANPLPVILTIKLWGVESLEGIQFFNDSIPGYESG